MKLWQKICFYSLLLFVVVFCAAGILLIENNKKTNINHLIETSNSEQASISSGLLRYALIRAADYSLDTEALETYMIEYLNSRINSEGVYTEILDKRYRIVYSNLDFELPKERPEIINSMESPQYIIRRIGTQTYLSISSSIKVMEQKFFNSYIIDISHVYHERQRQYIYFIRIFLVVILLLASGLYIISHTITKSVVLLTESAKSIASGNYSDRAVVTSKDEIGELTLWYNQMADTIQSKISELQLKTEAQQRFIDNFTHEIRTPLTAIVGYSDFLRSTICEEDIYQEMGQRIFSEGKRIEKLSVTMMDLIFVERNEFVLTPHTLGDIWREVNNTIRPALLQKEIKLKIKCSDCTLKILAEKDLISNLFCNLLDNALKASAQGSEIIVSAYKEEENIITEIQDYGTGIPEEDLPKIFESFYMADKVRGQENNGVGLGLSICRQIADIHHARIELDSKEGMGTTARVIFPNEKFFKTKSRKQS